MQKLGWLITVSVVTLGLVGYHARQNEPITFTTPQGYAAPMPIPKTTWKDSLTGALNPIDEEKVLILEMADEAKASPVKEVQKPKALKKAKTKARPKLGVKTAKLLPKRSKIH